MGKSLAIFLISGCISFASGTGVLAAGQDPQQDDRQKSQENPSTKNNDQKPNEDGGRVEDRRDDRKADERRADDGKSDDRKGEDDGNKDGETVTLPPDTMISVRVADEITTEKNKTGDIFTGIVDPSVMVHDRVVIPRGTEAHVRMAEGKKGGHIKGKAEIELELVSLVVNGRKLGVETDVHQKSKGALGAKAKAEREQGGGGAPGAGAMGAASMAGPAIAAFTAPKAEIKANTRVEFNLTSPFTFEKPPISGEEQH
jgi:hypothetical protein